MDKHILLNQLDYILYYIKNISGEYGGYVGIEGLFLHTSKVYPKISRNTFNQMVSVLVNDKLIEYKNEVSDKLESQKLIAITFYGLLFESYQEKVEKEEKDAKWKAKAEQQIARLNKTNNYLTWILALSSFVAAIYYYKEICQ